MNAVEFLKQDHAAIKDLLARAAAGEDLKLLFGSIQNALETHTYIEERLFYPKLQKTDNLKDFVQDAKQQHDLINQLLHEMQNQQGQEFEKSFQTLNAEVQLHLTLEENEIFPQVETLKTIDPEEWGGDMEMAKADYQISHRLES